MGGPDAIPVITDPDEARRAPELAVLSAEAHGKGEHAVEVALAAFSASAGLDPRRGRLYDDLVWAALSAAAQRRLEALMDIENYKYRSRQMRRPYEQGRAEALLRFLAARGLEVSSDAAARIRACTDAARLDAWLDQAATITTVDELQGG
jgi:hypothetical protein